MTLRPAGYRYYAADLAKHGYAAFLVHYFDRTGEEKLGEVDHSDVWRSTIREAIGFAAADIRKWNRRRIGASGILLEFSSRIYTRLPRIRVSKPSANITVASAMISPST